MRKRQTQAKQLIKDMVLAAVLASFLPLHKSE